MHWRFLGRKSGRAKTAADEVVGNFEDVSQGQLGFEALFGGLGQADDEVRLRLDLVDEPTEIRGFRS